MESFKRLAKIPVELGVIRWPNMCKERVYKILKIEEVAQKEFTGHIAHFQDVENEKMVGKVYPPKSFLYHLKEHKKEGDEVYFYIKEDSPPGEVDFDVRFKPKA